MKKYIIMMLLSSFIGIFSNPEILSASNSVTVTGLNDANIVETVIPEPEPVAEVASYEYYAEPAYSYAETYEEPVYEPQMLSYWVTAYRDTIEQHPGYYDIYQTGKLIYAHNTSDLLYSLNYLYTGDVFMINGVTYRVSDRVIYEKTDAYSLNGSRAVMKNLKNNAYGHTFALMTCYGTYYGNGDASHRLVIFADAM